VKVECQFFVFSPNYISEYTEDTELLRKCGITLTCRVYNIAFKGGGHIQGRHITNANNQICITIEGS